MLNRECPKYADFTNQGEDYSVEEYYWMRRWGSKKVNKAKMHYINRRGRKKLNKRIGKVHSVGIFIQLKLGQYDCDKRKHRFKAKSASLAYFNRTEFLSTEKQVFI